MQTPRVRVARFGELDSATAYRLWKLRADVFVVEQNCVYPDLDARDLEPGTLHVWIEDQGEPVAYLRVLDDGSISRIGRVCVEASHRRGGLAARLMDEVLVQIGDEPSELNAQAHVAGWYERFGYVVCGPEFLDDGIPHVPMSRAGTKGGRP